MEEQQAQDMSGNETQDAQQKKPTPWYGQPRCDEFPEQSNAEKWLGKAGQWAQDKVLKGAPKPLKWLANKIAPWKYKDGFRGQCPIDEDKKE